MQKTEALRSRLHATQKKQQQQMRRYTMYVCLSRSSCKSELKKSYGGARLDENSVRSK